MSFLDHFRQGPEERAAQAHLAEMPAEQYRSLGLEQAEALSDAVWEARGRDQEARRGPLKAIDDEERYQHVVNAMHLEFVRDDFLDRLADHAGIEEGDRATAEQFAAFDAHRRARHERDYDDQDREIGS